MRVILVRHAPAGEREEYAKTGKPDESRPLTEEGRRKMARSAKGLKELIPDLDVLASSPLVRAQETARILQKRYPRLPLKQLKELSPSGGAQALARWLQGLPPGSVVALVGHEPSLSGHAAWLLTGKSEAFFELKKGGACLIEFEAEPGPAKGSLRWLLQPSHLRGLTR